MHATATVSRVVPTGLGCSQPRRSAARLAAGMRLAPQQQQRRLAALGDKSDKSGGGIRREDEPEEYWTSEAERAGKNPFQDPLAQIGILAILFPFLFLGVAIAVGWVDVGAGAY